MIHRIDDNVGDVFQLLKDLNLDDNTLVIFTSDNGPHNEGNDPRYFASWGPFDGIKRDLFEGGLREPTIVHWPGHVPSGATSDEPTVQYDWMATFANLTGVPKPAITDGISILPTITGHAAEQQHHPYLYFEYQGPDAGPITKEILARHNYTTRGQMQAVRLGDMVGVRYDIQTPDDPLELYNVKNDLHENHNLAADPIYAPVLAKMRTLLITSREPVADAPRPYDDVPMPAVPAPHMTGGIRYAAFTGQWPWLPDFRTMRPSKIGTSKTLSASAGAAAQFTGYIQVPADGDYHFDADSSCDLWIHDGLIIRDTDTSNAGSVKLKAGWHPLRVAASKSNLQITITGGGIMQQPIAANMLGYDVK